MGNTRLGRGGVTLSAHRSRTSQFLGIRLQQATRLTGKLKGCTKVGYLSEVATLTNTTRNSTKIKSKDHKNLKNFKIIRSSNFMTLKS